jgi:hypothetical protein
MSRKKFEIHNQLESYEERKITCDLEELQTYLDHYSVKYPDESTINYSIEQLRIHVPRRKQLLQILLAQMAKPMFRVWPFYRFTSIGLFLFGSLLLPNKIY